MYPTDSIFLFFTSYVLSTSGLGVLGSYEYYEPLQPALYVRSKRDTGRSMTFTGFFPNGAMSAYATSGNLGQWYSRHGNNNQMVFPGQGWHLPQGSSLTEEEINPNVNESDDKGDGQKVQDNEKDENPLYTTFNKKPKKKPIHVPGKSSEEETGESVSQPRPGGSNAAASLNAWFPIVLGMFPPSQESADAYYGSSRRSTTPEKNIFAHSVSHGPGGVASSHAVSINGVPEYRSNNYN